METPARQASDIQTILRRMREELHTRKGIPTGAPAFGANAPLASVIVLNFNGAAVLSRCLDHLLAQDYPNVEILVVDNNSSDDSVKILDEYRGRGVMAIRSGTNLGVPGGRNLGLRHARGDIVAFIDADGFAEPSWLGRCVEALESGSDVGAVAPIVFFDGNPLVMNGAGSRINRRGYGGDLCYQAPYEFAELPAVALYPMGCGMAVRRSALGRADYFDALPVKWYEDVELGIRLWSAGLRVTVAPGARLDHGMGHTDAFLPDRVYLCERARIRTVLKYFPARQAPRWLREEIRAFRAAEPRVRRLLRGAWLWNLRHLASALLWRWRARPLSDRCWPLLDPSWGLFPPASPPSGALRPDASRWRPHLIVGSSNEAAQLHFGWFALERTADGAPFRWTETHASAFFRLESAADACEMRFYVARADTRAEISIRACGRLDPIVTHSLVGNPGGFVSVLIPCALAPGDYEFQIHVPRPFVCPLGRRLGLAISSISFDKRAS